MRRLRVWVISPEVHRHGGTERCLAEELERWGDRFDLRLYTMHAEEVDLTGVEVVRIPSVPGPHLLRWVWWVAANTARRWWDARRQGRPPVVFSPGINALDADAIAVHIVFAEHWRRVRSSVWQQLRTGPGRARILHRVLYWWLVRRLERHVYSRPVTLWAVSARDAEALARRFRRPRPPHIPHGVAHPDRVHERTPGNRSARPTQLLLVANDAHKKGVDTAIAALAHLDGVQLTVLGAADRTAITRWAAAAGVADRVTVHPPMRDPWPYYQRADLVLAPSREDAFGLPPLEAMACGVPVVVSQRAGVAEHVEDGRHALILRDPEDPEELARLVRRILDDPGLADRLRREGRELAASLSWDTNAERAAALIEREATTPRVLVLASDASEHGGIGRATRTLLRLLVDRYGADRVGLLTVWRSRDVELPGWVRDPGRPGSGPVPLGRRLGFGLRTLIEARRWRRRLVVLAAHPHLAPLAVAAGQVAGAPVVVWCHGYESWQPRPTVRRALARADQLWAVSHYTADRLAAAGLPAGRIRVLPHALPTELPDPPTVPRDPRLVLTVARLSARDRYKGIDVLLEAIARLRGELSDLRLVVVGDGDDRPLLQARTTALGLDRVVRFVGRVDDTELARWYATASVFALPARVERGPLPGGEGFGLVFLEAAAAGLPVVAGRDGPAAEVVRDGETGLLVDPRDPAAVADAIGRLARDPELARRMGEAAHAEVHARFGADRVAAQVADLLEELAPRWRGW